MRDLHEGMIEMIFYQFAVNDAKIDFQEFLSIAQVIISLPSTSYLNLALTDACIL